jgi:hypothetical protein
MNSVTALMASHNTMAAQHCRHNSIVYLNGTVRVFRQKSTLEDAIGPTPAPLEALAGV